jgi:hypothetical protein
MDDLVVKSQRIDIAKVILVLIRRKTVSARCVTTGNHGLSGSPHLRIIGLPRNPMECGFDSLTLHKRCRCTPAFRASDQLSGE